MLSDWRRTEETARGADLADAMYINNGGIEEFLARGEGPHHWWQYTTGGQFRTRDAMLDFVERLEDSTCTHCHSVSRRGRFRFGGGCRACRGEEQFIHTHSRHPHELASCGMCHEAHGSSDAKHLVLQPEQACKQCLD